MIGMAICLVAVFVALVWLTVELIEAPTVPEDHPWAVSEYYRDAEHVGVRDEA